jgi:folate-binding protein YgfZ
MLSNDVVSLEAGPEGSGCPALLLTRTGRILADPHVLQLGDVVWLELAGAAVASTLEALDKFIIADDVTLRDCSGDFDRIALEGPAAPGIVDRAAGGALGLAPDAGIRATLSGVSCVVGAWGMTGLEARQVFAPRGEGAAVASALLEAGRAEGAIEAGAEALEILRIESGVPKLGAELDEDVLPPEARLERAVSLQKGCYRGQEVVARLASRGSVKHFLVGFACEGEAAPSVGAPVHAGAGDGRSIGEVTSSCVSPRLGPIALGYVRVPADAPGTRVRVGDLDAVVQPLPFPDPAA